MLRFRLIYNSCSYQRVDSDLLRNAYKCSPLSTGTEVWSSCHCSLDMSKVAVCTAFKHAISYGHAFERLLLDQDDNLIAIAHHSVTVPSFCTAKLKSSCQIQAIISNRTVPLHVTTCVLRRKVTSTDR